MLLAGYQVKGPFVRPVNLPTSGTNYFILDRARDGSVRVVSMGFSSDLRRTASDADNRVEALLKCKGTLFFAYLGPSVDLGPDVMQDIWKKLLEGQ